MHGCDMLNEYIQIMYPFFHIHVCHKEVEYTDVLRGFNINGTALIIVIIYSDRTVP